jgi:hypothetical protein
MKIINPIPFKILWLLLFFTLLCKNSNAQTCGSCAVPDCIGVKQYLNKPAAQAGTGKVSKNYVPTLTRTTGNFTTYATIRTDANGQVGVMQEIQISGATAQISAQMQLVLASRTYRLYALTDAACANPLVANIGNDGCSQTFNPAWTNLQPNTNYKIAITTNLGVLSAGYEYKSFNIRYYYAVRPTSQFTFNCGAATAIGNFYANGINGQSGTLRLPITGATSGTATFSVTGSGFTGFASVNIGAGQTWVSIPIRYDGSGATGNRTLTVTSLRGTGSCTPVVNVKPSVSTFSFNCASASATGSFVANHTGNQSGSLTIPLSNATAGQATFSVSGGGFSGMLATVLTAGQLSVSIPIVYDGMGVSGNHAVTIISPQGTGGCGLNINVLAPTGAFAFNCGTAVTTGHFVLNNVANQGGYVTIPMTGATAGTATFLVVGTGFTGTLTTQLVDNQTIISIPISYDGGGVAGMRPLTITSPQGTGSCLVQANVVTPSVAGAITFNCPANVTPIGSFVANGASGQKGMIMIDFATQLAGEVTFSVSNNGFTGSLTTQVAAGQTKANILLNYDGSGSAGNHAVTVTSSEATGSCTTNIPVQAIFDFSCAVYNTNSNFTANGVSQNGTLVIPLSNVSEGNATFTVSNNGFTGSLTTILRDSQRFVAIPVIYDGSGAFGNHAVTVASTQGSGTCLANVLVKNPNLKGCDFIKGQNVTFNIHSQNKNNGFITEYILTDSAGVIKYHTANQPFTNVEVGEYEGYAVNYQGVPIPNLAIGTQLNAIGGNCVSLSNALPIKVCTSFQFLGNGDVTGTFIANGNGGQTGILYIPLDNGMDAPIDFNVSGNGFTGNMTFTPNNIGQDTLAIPINFNGSGGGGMMPVEINGVGGGNTGIVGIWVMSPPPATPFAFDCGSAVLSGTFVANQTTQSGSITVNISGITATSTTDFTVTGTNFSGGLINAELIAGQTSISIPIDYNGATPAGNYNITIGSPHGSNTCTIAIPVHCIAPIVTSLVKNNPTLASCPTLDNGEIFLTVSGSNVRFSKNNGLTWQNSNGFGQLTAGTQVIRIQDSLSGCYVDTTIVLIAPNCNGAVEICNNGLDDDGDGKIDGEDDDCTPLACNVTGNNIYFNVTNQNVTIDYTQRYVLTDTTMIIQQISSNTSFTNVPMGQYRVYALNYRTADGIMGLTVGANWNAVTSTCLQKTAKALLYKICPTAEICNNGLDDDGDGKIDGEDSDCTPLACNNTSGRIIFNVTGQNVTTDYTQKYVLTDTLGVIKQIVSNTIFNNVVVGQYRVFGINYKTSSSITGLTVGANWSGVTGSCYQKSPALLFKVCTAVEICNNGLDDDNDGLIDEEDTDCGVRACNNTTGNITFTIAGQRTDSTFKQKYLLTNVLGTIQKVDTLRQFNNLATGQYRVYGINYDSTLVVTGMVVGQNIANLSNNYYQKSLPLLFKVCITNESICNDGIDNDGDGLIDNEDPDCPALACTDTLSNIFVTFNDTVPANYTRRYALTNQGGLILQVASTAQFGNLVSGSYRIYCVTYSSAAGITHLTPGDSILNVTGSDFIVSAPVLRKVCLNVTNEICNNLIDDDGDGKIDCEDSDCVSCGCNNYSGTLTFNVPVTNPTANHTRRYILTNNTGIILQVSSNPVFTDWASGEYRAYTFFYDPAQFTPTFGIGSSIFAQTGAGTSFVLAQLFKVCRPDSKFEVQLVIKSYNCATKKAQIQVQVKTQDGTSPFLMGDGNFRIDYNVLQMHTPILVNQDNFSNQAAAMDLNYSPQTLMGSSEGPTNGRISLNVTYSGANNGGKLVPNVWTTVSTLEMTATDTATRLQMAWRTNLVFPATGLTGVVLRDTAGNYETFEVTSGAVFIPLNYGIENYCNCTALDVKVLLEGPMNANTGLMGTILNQRGLLPGQIPIGLFGIPTPTGQPYNTAPWYYTGNEAITHYDSTVVDWVMVTVRSDSASADSVVMRKAGLLHQDGHVDFVDNCWSLPFNKRYFVVIEHRNHMGVMSPTGQLLARGGVIRHDFTQFNGYIVVNPNSTGQKLMGGKWTMLACDGKKNTYTNNFDINFLDAQYWKAQSGIFDAYRDSDFNLDADVNFFDSLLWKRNNGQYSGVPHR